MGFQKGVPRHPAAGRRAGTPNKATAEIREIVGRLFDADYWESVKQRLDRGRLAPAMEIRLLAYLYGEPKQTVDMPGLSEMAAALSRKVIHKHYPGPTKTTI